MTKQKLYYWTASPMAKVFRRFILFLIVLFLSSSGTQAGSFGAIALDYADNIEVVPSQGRQTWYVNGSVVFRTETGMIYCDSAVWIKDLSVRLNGSVIIDDEEYHLVADSLFYDLVQESSIAMGEYVELYSISDSIMAVGTYALMDQGTDYLYMNNRPTLYLRYPDSANMIEIISDEIYFEGGIPRAEASGDVKINSEEITTHSGCAIMYTETNILDLFDEPVAIRARSELTGQFISITTKDNNLVSIDVVDSANGQFTEPLDTLGLSFDRSILRGNRIVFSFKDGVLNEISCWGQAYSWYYPSDYGLQESRENEVSGDSISFDVVDESLQRATIIGGAMGQFLDMKFTIIDSIPDTNSTEDSSMALMDTIADSSRYEISYHSRIDTMIDTIDYQSDVIVYDFIDSLITLTSQAKVTSSEVALEAHLVNIDTHSKVVHAYSADLQSDTSTVDSTMTGNLQPNIIPVRLKDGNDILYGDYLEYSLDTKKGRIETSKSKYQTGFFYGSTLHREQKDIFYLEDGKYTTCNAAEPHFHFQSNNLKLIEGEKLIAKPVVFNIGRIPLFALPYYVFPLKKGRHSGFLPFTFGSIEQGDRYLRNVGYYWAASEYWDWQGAIDYFERGSRINFYSKVTYNKRYVFNGSISGSYAKDVSYSQINSIETRGKRWNLKASHNHTFSPDFKVNASGQIVSDASYYGDFSSDLTQRLNRTIRSQVNFTKRFGKSYSISGKFVHDENLDTKKRTDQLPSFSISLPSVRPFGSGRGAGGAHWYNALIITYRPNYINSSTRSIITTTTFDTTITILDPISGLTDTTIVSTVDSTKTRKHYGRANHAMTASFPLKLFTYITINPSVRYREEWYRVYQTDQSVDAEIKPGNYRAYEYSTSVSLRTNIYGTVNPNLFGLIGFRQTLSPSISYRFAPEIDVHPEVRTFVGGSAGNTQKSQTISFSLRQLYQAKIKSGEKDKKLNLLSINTGFNYNLESDVRPLSNMTTSINSTLLPKIKFYGSMTHSFYLPGTEHLNFWSPYLLNFNLNASLTLAGSRFYFDDVISNSMPGATDTSSVLQGSPNPPTASMRGGASKGWSLSMNYSHSSSGRGVNKFKRSFIRLSLRFNLTTNMAVSYSQYYDITSGMTINNQINLVRKLHCWTGNLFWVPIGSNHGWGFKLFVNAMPQIKIDQSANQFGSSMLSDYR